MMLLLVDDDGELVTGFDLNEWNINDDDDAALMLVTIREDWANRMDEE